VPVNRHGTTLAELMIALVLGGTVVGAFTRTLVLQRRAEALVASTNAPSAAADEVVRVATAALARVAASDRLVIRGDTAIDWLATVGVALACAAGGDTLVVPTSGDASSWESVPDSGDAVDVGAPDGSWVRHQIVAVRARANGATCGGAERTLQVQSALADAARPAVRVTRRMRFALYRGGDGAWWLGERRCPLAESASCSAAQPVAGPLRAWPLGLAFRIDSTQATHMVHVTARAGLVQRRAVVALRP
jgi:hypothetical protein